MNWLKSNWKRLLKWGGLSAGCVVLAGSGFVGARYAASGDTWEGSLEELAPADPAMVVFVPRVPEGRLALERVLDDLLAEPGLPRLESSPTWHKKMAPALGGSLESFRRETLAKGLLEADRAANEAGVKLFGDLLAEELVLCADFGAEGTEYVALSRVSRAVRFRWQFLDIAQAFFPTDPRKPALDYEDGVLRITTPARPPRGDEPARPGSTTLVAVLGDVLVAGNSPRLLNAVVAAHGGGKSLAGNALLKRSLALASPEQRKAHVAGLWLNLDRLRTQLEPEITPEGMQISPVDAYSSLPNSVVAIYPDILGPVNTMVARNVDTRPFEAAYYGLDAGDSTALRFDEWLLASEDRIRAQDYAHMRETWKQAPGLPSQLSLLPADTMMQVSFRQPLNVLHDSVFTPKERESLVGDFIVAMRGAGVQAQLGGPVEELMFAAAPRSYANGAVVPLGATDFPIPAFAIGFRCPGAKEDVARVLLEEYLQVQRGRGNKPGEEPRKGRASVVELQVEGRRAWGFEDQSEKDDFMKRLNLSIRCCLVNEWLLLTNSEPLLAHAQKVARTGDTATLANMHNSPFNALASRAGATLYVNLDQFHEYAGAPELAKVLRDNKYNTGLIEGRDPGDVRREIARQMGLDPADPKSLGDPGVDAEYKRRKEQWLQTCAIEGERYVGELQRDLLALTFLRDFTLTTTFADDHLHVQGVLRIG
ncbi:MAG: hypothetical protein IT463_11030 [Planctomycetes bacterium]|nr:hypothetical protein [Planctomycetota bacterium]